MVLSIPLKSTNYTHKEIESLLKNALIISSLFLHTMRSSTMLTSAGGLPHPVCTVFLAMLIIYVAVMMCARKKKGDKVRSRSVSGTTRGTRDGSVSSTITYNYGAVAGGGCGGGGGGGGGC